MRSGKEWVQKKVMWRGRQKACQAKEMGGRREAGKGRPRGWKQGKERPVTEKREELEQGEG